MLKKDKGILQFKNKKNIGIASVKNKNKICFECVWIPEYVFVPGVSPCQAFSDYQLQQMTSTFIDQFGFNEDEFAEQEERVEWVEFSDKYYRLLRLQYIVSSVGHIAGKDIFDYQIKLYLNYSHFWE